jgi:hypothetical protein
MNVGISAFSDVIDAIVRTKVTRVPTVKADLPVSVADYRDVAWLLRGPHSTLPILHRALG